MPAAMSIAGVDSGGGAGVIADMKTFAALGVHGSCVITSVTAQNTMKVMGCFDIPSEFIEKQFDAIISDIRIKCVKTGMLSSPDIVRKVAELIKRYKLLLVVDPVMTAEAGGKLLRDEAVEVLIEELLPLAWVTTPNIHEAKVLSGIDIKDVKDAEKAAEKIHSFGAEAVIVTGGHLNGTDVVYDGRVTHIKGRIVKGGTHGAGCTYSAAITAELAKGKQLIEAAQTAKHFVEKGILSGMKVGKGIALVNPLHIIAEAERYHVLRNVEEAVKLIEEHMCSELVPEVGCNIAMGISNAVSISDVAAVSGRMVRLKGKPHAVGCVSFGASTHVAKIVLTAMQYDAFMRSAMNIRYSDSALKACKKLGLFMEFFLRKDEPDGVSTMEWGVAYAIKKAGRVPDVIYDTGDIGKEAMIRILGRNAMEVAERAIKICAMMSCELDNRKF